MSTQDMGYKKYKLNKVIQAVERLVVLYEKSKSYLCILLIENNSTFLV